MSGCFKRLAAGLALLSMLLLFVAPLVSISLQTSRACHSSAHAHANDAVAAHHAPQTTDALPCESAQNSPHNLMSRVGLSPMEEWACGYCQLLIHLPFVVLLVGVGLTLTRLSAHCKRRYKVSPPCLNALYAPYLARAPPLFCNFS